MGDLARVVVKSNRFNALRRQFHGSAEMAVKKATFDIQGRATADAPVLTGNLANSIYAQMISPLHGRCTVGAEYGPYVDGGTYKMAARPFFTNAVEQVRLAFVGLLKIEMGRVQ